jgi:type III secretion protein T
MPSLMLDVQMLLVAMALVAPRALVCLSILPSFSFRTLTGLARNSVAIAITAPAILPTYLFVQQTPPDEFIAFMLITKEAALGCMLGVLMSIPMWVAQSVGSILDSQRSPIQLQSNNASFDQDASATGGLLLQTLVLVLIESGLFFALAKILIESYGVWPAFSLMPPFEPGHADILIKRFGEFFWYIAVYGGPVLIPLLFVDFAFAMVGIFASNLQVSFASSPVKSLVGLIILLLYWRTFSHYAAGDFAHLLDLVASLLQAHSKQ